MTTTTAGVSSTPRLVQLDASDKRWFDFALSHPAATIFHHPAWAGVLRSCYGYRPVCLAQLDERGSVVGGLTLLEVKSPLGGRRWIALPFTDYYPVLSTRPGDASLSRLLLTHALRNGVSSVEVHADLGSQDVVHPAEAVRHVLKLTITPEELYAGFSKMHRRNIKKAERAGVEVRVGNSAEDLRDFYHLHLLTRRRLGVPVQPKRFFEFLWRHILQQDLGFVVSAGLGGRTIASAVFLGWNGTLVYKFGASDHSYWEARPNNLLFSTAIRLAAERGYHTLDWGRTDREDQGLRDFKSGWGAKEEPLRYSIMSGVAPRQPSDRLQRGLGAVIRRSPLWVCRAVGELLYRYAA